MACLVFVLIGGIAFSACGKNKKPDIWKNAEISSKEEFEEYIARPDVDLNFSAYTSVISAKSMGVNESMKAQVLKGNTDLDLQAVITGDVGSLFLAGGGISQRGYVYKGMYYVSDPTGKYCYRPPEGISIEDSVSVPFAGGFTFEEWFDEFLNQSYYKEDGDDDPTYEEYRLQILSYKKIEQENGIKFRLDSEWSKPHYEDSETEQYTFIFGFENNKITLAEMTMNMKTQTPFGTMSVSLNYSTTASDFTSLPLPTNLEDRNIWPERDPNGEEFQWQDITLDEFNKRFTDSENQLKVDFSSFVYGDSENKIMRAKRDGQNEFSAEIGDVDEGFYVAIKNGKMYGQNAEGTYQTTPKNLDRFTNLYFVNQSVSDSMNNILQKEGGEIGEWEMTLGQTFVMGSVEGFTFAFECEDENTTTTVEFTLEFLNGNLFVAIVNKSTDDSSTHSNTQIVGVQAVPNFSFTFPDDMNTWQSIDEETFNSKFGF